METLTHTQAALIEAIFEPFKVEWYWYPSRPADLLVGVQRLVRGREWTAWVCCVEE
jgi:hypothetical protein